MRHRLIKDETFVSDRKFRWSSLWQVVSLFIVVLILEFVTPVDYVFGYLYTGPILISASRLGRKATFYATLIAVVLTILNLWIPGDELVQPSTLASRIIAAIALIVTGILSDRNRQYEQAIAQQQIQLQSQEELARVREDFASTLTHDLKTPLLGAIETLKAWEQGKFGTVTPTHYKILEKMIRSHQSTLQLVETLLDVYRNDTEGLQLQLASVDLVAVAQAAIASLTDLASSRQVYINLGYGDSDFRRAMWVQGDALQLERVFTNLLTNGINHSRRGGKVEVVLESQAGYCVVKVVDNGLGITSEQLPHLFERFYQGHSDRQAKGSGLGLYLTRQIITAHGGKIWAENRLPQGALFCFRLPALSVYT
ncbi:MAG: Adaptive-response sensory-kinase SasA [Chroococcidiopsis cubana SAG 39.79]|uniref:histidine kinase n=1 Tax=Chroococcidiopsis cubana SAG 39.79 TaxID=388085 RepID=A0AB37UB07_9CYAN|nr:HAMP domain-containing sensor histidine kinase [Chroococcidiopsis cubana]MDZ4876941.1 Adaptive-response sensory-kinase SasA [Chroococcidiopsis cubana SAG 39.79]PSB59726.1 two-component sensor histidine kinase [Chroococcidiopsis cubana CCALA 043]RUT02647.1 two-component sensor histidine kinase [Chroococcidiopsis cubana SAG 39.79]